MSGGIVTRAISSSLTVAASRLNLPSVFELKTLKIQIPAICEEKSIQHAWEILIDVG
jgi:hypothetical protein